MTPETSTGRRVKLRLFLSEQGNVKRIRSNCISWPNLGLARLLPNNFSISEVTIRAIYHWPANPCVIHQTRILNGKFGCSFKRDLLFCTLVIVPRRVPLGDAEYKGTSVALVAKVHITRVSSKLAGITWAELNLLFYSSICAPSFFLPKFTSGFCLAYIELWTPQRPVTR